MAKDVLLYGEIYSWSTSQFIRDVDDVLALEPDAEIVARINTPGGDPDYAFGAIAKFEGLKNKKVVIIDGKAHSMGLYFCCYTQNVIAHDVSDFVLHRCAYDPWIENNPDYFTDTRKKSLATMNKKLRAALEAKIDVPLFEKITGVTLDDVFSMDGQLDVQLSASQAKRIGLVKEVIKLTPTKKAEIENHLIATASKTYGISMAAKKTEETKEPKTQNKKTMTLAELKAEHPNLVEEITKEVTAVAATKERERIEAWAHFIEVDPKAVGEGIASGKAMTQLQIIELSEKKFNKKAIKDLEDDSEKKDLETGEPASKAKGANQKEVEAFMAGVTKNSAFLSEGAAKK